VENAAVAQTAKYAAAGMDPEKVAVGQRIREARLKADLSQFELAKLLDITGGAVGQWELGITIPKAQTIGKLTKLLGVSYEWLMNKEGRKIDAVRTDPEEHMLQLFRKLSDVEQEMVIRQLEGLTRSKR
jgi:transcriptional regulator with XRE-family HTH domain